MSPRIAESLISEAIEDLYPRYVTRLGEEMTTIYKQLAHKTLVKALLPIKNLSTPWAALRPSLMAQTTRD